MLLATPAFSASGLPYCVLVSDAADAWRLLLGTQEVYTIQKNDNGKFIAYGNWNDEENRWEELMNSPHDGFQGLHPNLWPEVGSHDEGPLKRDPIGYEADDDDLFERLCAWDETNYLLACGTKSGWDFNSTDGIVDGHAYTILTCKRGVAGKEIDLVKLRNPWGKGGELSDSDWADNGSGWEDHPEVKEELNPEVRNDGIFWVSKAEFFRYFPVIYVSCTDMTADKTDEPAGEYAENYEQ